MLHATYPDLCCTLHVQSVKEIIDCVTSPLVFSALQGRAAVIKFVGDCSVSYADVVVYSRSIQAKALSALPALQQAASKKTKYVVVLDKHSEEKSTVVMSVCMGLI